MAELLRLAGPRPAPPRDRALRVRSAVERSWTTTVRRRRFARAGWAVAALAAAAMVAWLMVVRMQPAGIVDAPASARLFDVTSIAGSATVLPAPGTGAAGERPLRAGEPISAGSAVETDPRGGAALASDAGIVVRLDAGTRIRVEEGVVLALDRGAVYVDTGPGGERRGAGVTVRTPLGEVHHVGTQFEVRLDGGSVQVSVREGMVRLDGPNGTHEVRSGQALSVDGDGSASIDPIAISGDRWSWAESMAVMPDIEGMTLRAFLDWAARERGLELAFAGDAAEESASSIRLSGSVEGLTTEEALLTVLPTCRMIHQVDDGRLLIEPEDGPGASG